MDFIAFITAGPNMPFTVALGVVVGLFLLELFSFLMGMGSAADSLLPDFDHDLHIDGVEHLGAATHGDMGTHGWVAALSWCHVGRVPILILLAVFLAGFGAGGLLVQYLSLSLFGGMVSAWLAAAGAFVTAILAVRVIGGILARVLPKDETTAVSRSQFVGHTVVLSQNQGPSRLGSSGEAKLRDAHGQTHYLRVEPAEPDIEFQPGERVLIVGLSGSVFQAVPAPNTTIESV